MLQTGCRIVRTSSGKYSRILTAYTGPDRSTIALNSAVSSASDYQLVVILDAGLAPIQVPRYVSDAIYGRVPGAVLNEKNRFWTVPGESLTSRSGLAGSRFPSILWIPSWANLVIRMQTGKLRASDA
jgi:hypothetical protein